MIMRKGKRIIAAVLAMVFAAGAVSVLRVYEVSAAPYAVPDCTQLTDGSAEQDRWLTMPDSRLVVNPYNFKVSTEMTQHDYCDGEALPLNIGFASPYVEFNDRVQFDDMLEVYGASATGVAVYEPEPSEWHADDSTMAVVEVNADGSVYMANTELADPKWQRVSSNNFVVNVTARTLVTFEVTEHNGGWNMKVGDTKHWQSWNFPVEDEGRYTFNLSRLTGKTGELTIRLEFFVVGDGSHLTMKNVAVLEPALVCAEEYTVAHNPAVNTADAEYAGGSLHTEDYFADELSVMRRIEYEGLTESYICGSIYGKAQLTDGTLVCRRENEAYAIAVSGVGRMTFYRCRADMLLMRNGSTEPDGCCCFIAEADTDGTTEICISMDTIYSSQPSETAAHARAMLAADAEALLAARIAAWNAILAAIPVPGSFELTVTGAEQLNSAETQTAYYGAWALIAASVLPAAPEVGQPYRTLANGKPSLWSCGAEGSRYTAMWDSPFGMRLLAYVDPDAAWDCLFGLLCETGEDGSIGGEGLPTQKAHTMWHIYRLSPDREKLSRCIDELDRHTHYSLAHPYWVYPGVNMHPDTKDALYTVPLSREMEYLALIYNELRYPERAAYWRSMLDEHKMNLLYWHFSGGSIYTYCRSDGVTFNRYNYDNDTLTSQELVYVSGLRTYYRQLLKAGFTASFDPAQVGGGLQTHIRAQEPLYTMYGWAAAGEAEISSQLCEVVIRDILKTVMFSENYTCDEQGDVVASGVRPSLFTAALFIESVALRNDIRIDDGLPYIAGVFGEGSLSNIHIGEKTVSISVSEGTASVAGGLECSVADGGYGTAPFTGRGYGLTLSGDFDGDDGVTAADALDVLRAAVGLSAQPDGLRLFAGDSDSDGTLTVSDALLILRIAVNLV